MLQEKKGKREMPSNESKANEMVATKRTGKLVHDRSPGDFFRTREVFEI